MDEAVCPDDGTPLRVLEVRMPSGGPLLQCPTCEQSFTLTRDGIGPVPGQ